MCRILLAIFFSYFVWAGVSSYSLWDPKSERVLLNSECEPKGFEARVREWKSPQVFWEWQENAIRKKYLEYLQYRKIEIAVNKIRKEQDEANTAFDHRISKAYGFPDVPPDDDLLQREMEMAEGDIDKSEYDLASKCIAIASAKKHQKQ